MGDKSTAAAHPHVHRLTYLEEHIAAVTGAGTELHFGPDENLWRHVPTSIEPQRIVLRHEKPRIVQKGVCLDLSAKSTHRKQHLPTGCQGGLGVVPKEANELRPELRGRWEVLNDQHRPRIFVLVLSGLHALRRLPLALVAQHDPTMICCRTV